MSKFSSDISELRGKKVRFYMGGGAEGIVRGTVHHVDGNLIYIQESGAIHGTVHTVTLNAEHVRFYEIDLIGNIEDMD